MNIVFSINPLGLEGLGATITSLIRNCSDGGELHLYFLCSELRVNDKNNILQLLQNENFEGKIDFIDFNAKSLFGHLKSLHGDWTTYGRLLIPDVIKADSAIYLDSDLVINIDILEFKKNTSDNILSAVCGCEVKYSLDSLFLVKKLNWSDRTPYFNAGVLHFNILMWKKNNLGQKIKDLSERYSDDLISNDQTLLNAICEGKFTNLPKEFNLEWYPNTPIPENIDDAIIHFVGSPKPWDFFGQIVHDGYKTWKKYSTTFWDNQYSRITVHKLKRTIKIRRSILKNLKRRLAKR